MIERWDKVESALRGDYRVFRVREDVARSPESGIGYSFFVVESNDWMNVIPITEDGRIVCVRQYRHGTEEISLEIPGGIVDDGESTIEAARRELLEETGYAAEEMVEIGVVAPNPAIQNNRCHSFLAKNARPVREQKLDATEEIHVVLVDPADVPGLIAAGTISHALVVAAFYLWEMDAARDGSEGER